MIRSIVGTVGTRVAVTLLNLGVVMAAGHALGAAGVGTISLIVLGAAFILLVNNVVGGGGLVYLTPRYGPGPLRWLAYGWTLITGLLAWWVLQFLPMVPAEWVLPVAVIAVLQGFCNTHLGLILGQQRIGVHNGLLVLLSALLAIGFIGLLRRGGAPVHDYVQASYLAHGITAMLSGLASVMGPRISARTPGYPVADLFRQGVAAQSANGLQLMTYRFAYFLVDRWGGTAALGIYSVTTQLAESAWLIPKSMGLVLYTRVSNGERSAEQNTMVLTAMRAAVAAALAVIILLLLVPDGIYRWVFGNEITGLTRLVLLMTPGLLAMAASQALSHFLSGTGRVVHNAVGSGIGALITLGLGYALIPTHGLSGAALTASGAYGASVLYQWLVFQRITDAGWRDLLPTGQDRQHLLTLWRQLSGR